jgi:hypothetical protein
VRYSLQGLILTALVFAGLIGGLFVVPYLSAKYPDSWLAIAGMIIAVVAGMLLAVVLVAFIMNGMHHLSSRNRYIVVIMAFYVGAFVLFEMVAREQRLAHFRKGELAVGDWTRQVVRVSNDADPDTLAMLYRQGLWIEGEFGGLMHPDFRKHMKHLSDLLPKVEPEK